MSASIPRTSGIYQITCLPTGKIYIGSAVDLWDRWRVHRNDLTRRYGREHTNAHLQRAWDKYGESAFVFGVLEYVEPARLIEREQYYLDLLRPYDHNIGFNISKNAGSALGVKHSEETRRKVSSALQGRPVSKERVAKLVAYWTGRKHRPESIEKMRQSKLGKLEPPNAARAKVEATSKEYIVTDPDGNEFLIKNLNAFCREHGLTSTSMVRLARQRKGVTQHKGWKCRYP